MADFLIQLRTVKRVEFVLRNPTTGADLEKAVYCAAQECEKRGVVVNDDTITISADEDHILLSVPVSDRVGPLDD